MSRGIAAFIFAVFSSIALSTVPRLNAEALNLRAGAARIDSTPTDLAGLTTQWRKQFTAVHDHIYVRALVLDNGVDTAAIVAVDLVEFGDLTSLRERIAKETGIAADHLLITASHAHASPRARLDSPGGTVEGGLGVGKYTPWLYDRVVEAVKQAKASLKPARIGVGTGKADVNLSRDEYVPGGWKLGLNPDGPSEKTVWVVKVETPTGEPIALFFNYAVHSVIAGPDNDLLTGDLAGAAERYVEQHYQGKTVALFTMGPAGDQNPKFIGPGQQAEEAVPSFDAIAAQGLMLGAEVVRVANHIEQMAATATIAASERVVYCPTGPRRPHPDESKPLPPLPTGNQAGGPGAQADRPSPQAGGPGPQTGRPGPGAGGPGAGQEASPGVKVGLGLIKVNDIAFTGVNGEVVTNIYWHLKNATPLKNTILLTMANGRNGYIVDDASYDKPIFEVYATAMARGCAENAIVNNLVEMINTGR